MWPRLKWPNDLVVGDRKLAGVLAEADWRTDSTVAVVVGLGLNVRWESPLPEDIRATAVALNQLGGTGDREAILVEFLRRLDVHYRELVDTGDRGAVLDGWRNRSATIGRRVRVDLGARQVEGTAVDLTDEGHLVVDTDGRGHREVFAVGDVVHVRPSGG